MSTPGHIAPDLPPGSPAIHYLRRREIDTTRWDHCIEASLSPLIYARSFYLDAMAAGQWDALVLDDYHAVMPLTWRSKFGIRYLYQPAFTQQTGIFSAAPFTTALIESFLREADRHFRFAEIYLNYSNAHQTLEPRTNFPSTPQCALFPIIRTLQKGPQPQPQPGPTQPANLYKGF